MSNGYPKPNQVGLINTQQVRLKKPNIGYICFPESDFQEITFQTFLCLFAIRKVGQQKTLSS